MHRLINPNLSASSFHDDSSSKIYEEFAIHFQNKIALIKQSIAQPTETSACNPPAKPPASVMTPISVIKYQELTTVTKKIKFIHMRS